MSAEDGKRECFICGEDNEVVLEEHHKVPQRLGGSNEDRNLVVLCANCHRAVEAIYDDEFWDRIPAIVRKNREGPFVSSFTEQEVCPECLRRFNTENGYVDALDEPKSPLYDD